MYFILHARIDIPTYQPRRICHDNGMGSTRRNMDEGSDRQAIDSPVSIGSYSIAIDWDCAIVMTSATTEAVPGWIYKRSKPRSYLSKKSILPVSSQIYFHYVSSAPDLTYKGIVQWPGPKILPYHLHRPNPGSMHDSQVKTRRGDTGAGRGPC